MRVIIPAAGRGTRLYPLTETRSKALVPVCNRPLLSYALEWLSKLPIDEVVLVVGHQGRDLRSTALSLKHRPPLRFVENPDYASTNSAVSLALTVPYWTDPLCVIDGDVLPAPSLLKRLVTPGPSALVVDTAKTVEAADMKVEMRGASVWHLDKNIPKDKHHGEFFGLSRWSGNGLKLLARTLRDFVKNGRTDVWYEFAIRDVAKETEIAAIPAREDEWAEVDRAEDIPLAERLIRQLMTS